MLSDKAKMRVKIAKDVLAALETKRIVAKHGCYVRSPEVDKEAHKHADEPGSMGSNQFTAPGNCSVCAIGGMFVAAVDRNNSLHLKDIYDTVHEEVEDLSLVRYLKRWFTVRQLDLVEIAFEGHSVFNIGENHQPSENNRAAAGAFYLRASERLGTRTAADAEERMTAIMQNIIDNNGTFKP